MTAKLEIDYPSTLLLHGKSLESVQQRSLFLLALKYFELGELSSGQAATMCGLSRVSFLSEAARNGVPATDLEDEELAQEFSHA
jgi:predicted HTH domain antitoxin